MTTAGYLLLLFVAALALSAIRLAHSARHAEVRWRRRATAAEDERDALRAKRSMAVSQGNRTRYARRREQSDR